MLVLVMDCTKVSQCSPNTLKASREIHTGKQLVKKQSSATLKQEVRGDSFLAISSFSFHILIKSLNKR